MISTFERLRSILAKDYQLAPEVLTMDANLESLGIDSLGVAELLFSIEDEFRVTLPPEPAELNTVADVVHYIDALVGGRRPVALRPVVTNVATNIVPNTSANAHVSGAAPRMQ